MVHKLAPAAGDSPADASHLIFLMEHPNRAAARRCTGLAGAPSFRMDGILLQKRRSAAK
jgi:hypothetical protein